MAFRVRRSRLRGAESARLRGRQVAVAGLIYGDNAVPGVTQVPRAAVWGGLDPRPRVLLPMAGVTRVPVRAAVVAAHTAVAASIRLTPTSVRATTKKLTPVTGRPTMPRAATTPAKPPTAVHGPGKSKTPATGSTTPPDGTQALPTVPKQVRGVKRKRYGD